MPIIRNRRIKRKEDLQNRWVLGIDSKDRDGLFVGRKMRPINIFSNYQLYLQPQFLLQRAMLGKTNSYINNKLGIQSKRISSEAKALDLFGLRSEIAGKSFGWDVSLNSDLSSLSLNRFTHGSRHWVSLSKQMQLPILNQVQANLFGAYRYKAWNGTLGETDIYTAYGGYVEKRKEFAIGKLTNNSLLRLGFGRYQAEAFRSSKLLSSWRANLYGSLNSSYPLWVRESAELKPYLAYRYSPVPIIPGLRLNSSLQLSSSYYQNGNSLNRVSLSIGPTLTMGTFSKEFFDYTKLSLAIGGTIKEGQSPFDFDAAVDLGTFSVGLTQQIVGPLLFKGGWEFNIDKSSESFGKSINSRLELLWQKRSYDFGVYYNPYEGMGGIRIRLNDFQFGGTGLPFIPSDTKTYSE